MGCIVVGAGIVALAFILLFARDPIAALMKAFGIVAVMCVALMVGATVYRSVAPLGYVAASLEAGK